MLPTQGYYRVELEEEDLDRLRRLAERAAEMMEHPTKLVFLQTQALAAEFSLIALREIGQPPLTARRMARTKTEQALGWYGEHVAEAPTFRDVAKAVRVSPTHLRRLFHQFRGESPHKTMKRLRMERAEEMLKGTDLTLDAIAGHVGLSNGSALSRAVKAHFGITPRNLRRGRRPVRMIGHPAAPRSTRK